MDIANHPTVKSWLQSMSTPDVRTSQLQDHPNYWHRDPSLLLTKCDVHSLTLGTGASIYKSMLPSIEAADFEVILVTCFWARSTSLDYLNDTLRKLSAKAVARHRFIRVRICFSSSSLWQKIFHTWSLSGKTYPPSTWTRTLGLPSPSELTGLDLEIKSIFLPPFSVMHPKFILIDRKLVHLPSCNISWENWFEGCLQVSGPLVHECLQFWMECWATETDIKQKWEWPWPGWVPKLVAPVHADTGEPALLASRSLSLKEVPAVFLPSPHHRNPRFCLPWHVPPAPPPTPLNTFLLTALNRAEICIVMQTPNLTAEPVLTALLAALERGVHVRILTSERLMILEQFVTAGTTTARCVRRLTDAYQQRARQLASSDLESGGGGMGQLRVEFYTPRLGRRECYAGASEPVQSHFKMTIIDDSIVVLGSGNMDRASWFTSQELGVAFFSTDLVEEIQAARAEALKGRTNLVFDSLTDFR
jgi:phosphatidylserine/phosphatidylglycerophosphate/cardiolipin synthase-like enzyme